MPPAPDTGLRHGFYVRFLERAFERRLGHEMFFLDETGADGRRLAVDRGAGRRAARSAWASRRAA